MLTDARTDRINPSAGIALQSGKTSKEVTWETWKFRSRNFSMITGEFFDWQKYFHITIAKGSFTVLYYMIFDCCESVCYMLRKDGSRIVTIIKG